MSKYRGRNFGDYLKEKGISEEVSTRAKKRWEVLRAEASIEPEDTTESGGDSPKQNNGFLHRIRRSVNHLFTQSRPMRK